jgi:hypothetical protein
MDFANSRRNSFAPGSSGPSPLLGGSEAPNGTLSNTGTSHNSPAAAYGSAMDGAYGQTGYGQPGVRLVGQSYEQQADKGDGVGDGEWYADAVEDDNDLGGSDVSGDHGRAGEDAYHGSASLAPSRSRTSVGWAQ